MVNGELIMFQSLPFDLKLLFASQFVIIYYILGIILYWCHIDLV